MRTLENLTTLNHLKQASQNLVENKLLILLNTFNEMLASCRDEYDYHALMIAIGILNKFSEEQYRRDLLDSSPEEMEDFLLLKEHQTITLYKNYTQSHFS